MPRLPERITASGIRLVGAAAGLVSDAAAMGLHPPRREDLLFAADFTLRPRLGASPVDQALAVLSQALARQHRDLPALSREQNATATADRFHAMEWRVASRDDHWIGELLWRYPHPAVRGVPVTTHLVLSERPGTAALAIRTGTAGGFAAVYGDVGAGQAHPAFLAELNRLVRLVFHGRAGDPGTLTERDIERFVREVLLAESREHPVVVLAPTEQGEYLVPPAQLAEELLGLAHLYVMDRHPTTFRLSDTLGDRRLSCYWGAARAYLPGFSCADDPREHPLLVGDRVGDPVVRAQLRGELSRSGCEAALPPAGVDSLMDAGSRAPTAAPPPSAAAAVHPATPVQPPLASSRPAGRPPEAGPGPMDELLAAIRRLVALQENLLDEIAGLRATNAVRGATAAGLERRIGALERLIRDRFAPVPPEPAAEPAEPGEEEPAAAETTLAGAVRQAALAHDDALLVLDEAIAAAEESPYEDVDRVAAVLDAMALVARRRQAGTLGAPLREAFRELGVDYRGGISEGTPERLRQQYDVRLSQGETVPAVEHIALGGSYDPRHCLRIYFTSRAPAEPRFVIAHVGRHREVKTTT